MQLRASQCGLASHRRSSARAVRIPFSFPKGHVTGSSVQQTRCSSTVAQAKLKDVSFFSESSVLGPATTEKATTGDVDSVQLESTVGMDYTVLRDLLKAGDFSKADDETRALLIKLAGEGAVKRNWVYWSEVKSISNQDFQTIDNLWKAASNGKFGFSVQKEMFAQTQKRWSKFFKQIDWTQGENNIYRKWPTEFKYTLEAPKGHLPLTNALRGTQLFQAIMDHPAFEKQAKMSIDQRAAQAAKVPIF